MYQNFGQLMCYCTLLLCAAAAPAAAYVRVQNMGLLDSSATTTMVAEISTKKKCV
jgi:hypothetical protein